MIPPRRERHTPGSRARNKRHARNKRRVPVFPCVSDAGAGAGAGRDRGPAAAAAAAQYGTRIAFVNNHLAAHQENIARRISDVREVFGGLELGYHRCRSGLSS